MTSTLSGSFPGEFKNMFIHIRIAFISMVLLSLAVYADFDRRIPVEACGLTSDTSICYYDGNRTVTVGRDVNTLRNLFRICLSIDTLEGVIKPLRVVLAVDGTSSMCRDGAKFHNDIYDMRIEAANLFIDSLAQRSRESEVGLVAFFERLPYNRVFSAVELTDRSNINDLKQHVETASCEAIGWGRRKTREAGGILATYIGNALVGALELVDEDYDRIAETHTRHIIILTDGQWDDDETPRTILNQYQRANPGRELPTIHGVFLSDSAWHVNHGEVAFPEGEELEYVVNETGGIFISNAQPVNIVERLLGLLEQITQHQMQTLQSFSITDLATGQSHSADVSRLTDGENDWLAQASNFDLKIGENKFLLSKTVGGEEINDTLVVNRKDGTHTNPGNGFTISCAPDTLHMEISSSPDRLYAGSFSSAEMEVSQEDLPLFQPANTVVRVCRPYSTQDGASVVMHFDGTLSYDVGRGNVMGNPDYTDEDALFGRSISGGRIEASVGALQGEAVLAAWIKPDDETADAVIFSSENFTFGMRDGHLYFIDGTDTLGDADTLKSRGYVDRDVWQHVAVVRRVQSVWLYINGLTASEAVSYTAPLGSDPDRPLIIGPVDGYTLDEVSLSERVITETVNGVSMLRIPTVSGVGWSESDSTTTGSVMNISELEWQDGISRFSYTVSEPRTGIIQAIGNLKNGAAWSKMGEPVEFLFAGVYAEADFFDMSGDGYLDRIVVSLSQTDHDLYSELPDVSDLVENIRIETLENQIIHLNPLSIDRIDDSSFLISLDEHTTGPYETGWKSARITFSKTPLTIDSLPVVVDRINDRAGAVVQKAIYIDNPRGRDTLIAHLSEPVSCLHTTREKPGEVFYYYKSDGRDTRILNRALFAQSCTEEFTSVYRIVLDEDTDIYPYSDSLQLVAFASDHWSNLPPPPERALKKRIESSGQNAVVISVSPNPFDPTEPNIDLLPQNIKDAYAGVIRGLNVGTLISISTDKPLQKQGENYGWATVIDAVGNRVKGALPVQRANEENERLYGVVWDGTNENGRIVGPNAYLLVIRVKDIEGKDILDRTKVGVAR